MQQRKPVLVTGSHRSGSTWVGRMLSFSPDMAYLYEPFNLLHDSGMCGINFVHWYTYVCDANSGQYSSSYRQTLQFHYDLQLALSQFKDTRSRLISLRNVFKHWFYRISKKRPLIKDPIALLSSEWLASHFDMQVVVLIRHPAAFAGSLKINNWAFPFAHFLEQELLMKDHLHPFDAELTKFAQTQQPIVAQAALLWKILHYMIGKFQKQHPEWLFVRHEDLSRDPIGGYEQIYKFLGMEYTKPIQTKIRSYSLGENEHPAMARDMHIRRTSLDNIAKWKERLTEQEVQYIRETVQPISQLFYHDDEW